jgi:hypothetical protein
MFSKERFLVEPEAEVHGSQLPGQRRTEDDFSFSFVGFLSEHHYSTVIPELVSLDATSVMERRPT